jgi:hypothetical protein
VAHPATLALRQVLRLWQEEYKEQWAAGAYTDMSQFGTAILNAKAIGNCEALERVLGLDYNQAIGEIDDSYEYERTRPSGSGGAGEALRTGTEERDD